MIGSLHLFQACSQSSTLGTLNPVTTTSLPFVCTLLRTEASLCPTMHVLVGPPSDHWESRVPIYHDRRHMLRFLIEYMKRECTADSEKVFEGWFERHTLSFER